MDEGSSASMHGVQAQTVSPRWAIGQYQVQFPEPGSDDDLVETPLPIPDDPAAEALGLTYDGAAPTTSVHVQEDDQGDLLFFIVDGNVYDRWGYLIAPASTALNDHVNGLLWKGTGEVVAAPVPGRCGLWYLFHSRPLTSDGEAHRLAFSVLDLTIPNPSFPSDPDRWGILRSYENSTMPDFENGDFDLNPANEIPTISSEDDIVNGKIQMKAVHDTYTGRGFLLAATPYHLVKYELLTDEVRFLDSQFLPHFPDPDYQYEPQRAKGELEAFAVNGQIRVAHSFNNLFYTPPLPTIPPTPAEIRMDLSMHFARFDANQPGLPPIGLPSTVLTGTIVFPNTLLDGQNDPITTFCIGGVEFSPNGRYTYFAKSFAGGAVESAHLAYWDWNSNTLTALVDVDLTNFLDSRMELNSFPAEIGSGDAPFAIYLSGTRSDGQHILGALKNPDTPNSTNWLPEVFETSSINLCSDPSLNYTGQPPPDRYALIQKQGFDDQTLPMLVEADCCADVHAFTGFTDYTAEEGTAVWTTTSNPFGTVHTVRMNGTFTIPAGANVIANNMHFTFAPGATMVVERGGRFVSNGCTFTSGCEERWAGIRVEGKRNNPVQTQTGLPVNERQGWLYLTNSEVANAELGVRCTGPLVNGSADWNYTGGVVRASSTTFRNCIGGVLVERYQRSSGGAILPNLCHFSNCTFETTADWPDLGVSLPKAHAYLFDVQGIRFMQCKFRNEASGSFAETERGWGIYGIYAGFDVEGTTVQDASLFQGLSAGVNAASGPFRKVNIRRSWFRDNLVGANLQACFVPEVSRSYFFVPPGSTTEEPPTGLILHQSTGYLVEENSFDGGSLANMNVGLLIKGEVRAENQIYNNTFADLAAGTYTVDRQKGNTQQTEFLGLQLLCSDYTDCGYEYLLGDNTYIKSAQGFWNSTFPDESQLAANRFFNGGISGISISELQPSGANAPFFNYFRHNVAECDPQDDGNDYFNDIPIGPAEFNKATDCGKGLLPVVGGGGGVPGFQLAAAQLLSAQSHFTETVDIGDRETLLDAIRQTAPLLPSHTLRDYLVGHSPLSDEVLLEAIYREVPLDAWHLTQVMLANAKLTERVYDALERCDLLGEYMLAIVRNAGDGPTVKDLLQQEVELRSAEKAHALVLAVTEFSNDSTLVAPAETLYDLLAIAPDHTDYYTLASMALERGQPALAISWLDSLTVANDDGYMVIHEIATMQNDLGNNWSLADATQRTRLLQLAEKSEPGAAMAWAICFYLGLTAEMPLTAFPFSVKRLGPTNHQHAGPSATSFLQAQPNPTTGTCMVVVGTALDEVAQLRVTDPSGRTVRTLPLPTGNVLVELDLGGLANGLYAVELLLGDMKLGATKVTLQH